MWRRTRRERQGVISHTATHPPTRPARINPLHPRPSQVCFWLKATGSTHYAFVLLTPTCFCFALCYRKTSPSPGFVIKPKRYSLCVDTPPTTLAMNLCRLFISPSLSLPPPHMHPCVFLCDLHLIFPATNVHEIVLCVCTN